MTQIAEPVMAEESPALTAAVEPALGLRGLELDDDLVLIDLLTDRSFRLNATGRFIWTLLQERCRVTDVVDALERQYRINPEYAREVATAYLTQLQELGLAAIQGETTPR